MRKNGLTRLFSVILALALMLTTMPFSAITVNAVTNEFAGGSGTENDPYLISTKQHLNNVRNHLTSFASPYFELTNDIVFEDGDFAVGGEYYNEGKLWLPIGHNTLFNFSGTFDGNGFSIINLKINGQATEHGRYGLFSECAGTIKNLSIKNANITVSGEVGPYYVGGLVGELTVINGAENVADELRRIGNNINQIARAVNSGYVNAVDLTETRKELKAIWQSLNALLQDAQ